MATTVAAAAAVLSTSPAHAAVSAAGAAQIAAALKGPGTTVTSASFATLPPTGSPHGVAGSPLAAFPTDGPSFSILTTGSVAYADDPNNAGNSGTTLGGGAVRGDTDMDVSVLRIDFAVPATANCVSFDFGFYSEEFPEFVNSSFNDAFIAELDRTTWTTNGSVISAPDNFAFDPNGEVISINSTGVTSVNAANAAGTTYDGGTTLLRAAKPVTPGRHALYLSLFDQGDTNFDSAVFLDNLVTGFAPNPAAQCAPGATEQNFSLDLTPATASGPTGTPHTVTATVTEVGAGPASGGAVLFTVVGANPRTGRVPVGGGGAASYTYTGTTAGTDTISACYDANANNACDAGEATATATRVWTGGGTSTPSCAGATPTISSNAASVVGTPGADVIIGGPAGQRIDGRGGADTICGGGGNDVLNGGPGDDHLDGQGGQDIVIGGAGNDVEHGGDLRDKVGGKNNDPGADQLFGDGGSSDQCFATPGSDTVDASCEISG